jgi:MFS transporter, AAHS family, 4-hydroxybenzoate transporter
MSTPHTTLSMRTGEPQELGPRGLAIIILCALVALLDGMDLQSIGLAAPFMADALHFAMSAFGLIFSVALLGMALGSFALGRLADQRGRKVVLIAATIGFGVFTLGTAFADNFGELLACRFLTGVGLGGAAPCFISLCSEHAPARLRATVVSLVWAGFPLGGVVGGLLASRLIPAFGWRSIFFAGGAPPLLIAVALIWAVPRSLARGENQGTSALAARGLEADRAMPRLFALDRAGGTILLWSSFFFTFMILVTNSAWTPTLLRIEGLPIENTSLVLATFNFWSLVGSSAAGLLLSRFGMLAVLPGAVAGSALAYALVGYGAPSLGAVSVCQGLFGLFAGCASSGLIAFAATLYPAAFRATGVGYAMAAGRCGSIVGPLVVGHLVGARWSTQNVFLGLGATVMIGALATLGLGLRRPPLERAGAG